MSASKSGSSVCNTSALDQLIEEINFQRKKEMRQLLKDDSGFVILQGTTYWTDLFVRHFLFQNESNIDSDDLLFFVRKKHLKGASQYFPKYQTELEVFRRDSRKLPVGDPDVDWEETVYVNLIVHQFYYTITLAICTRTSPKDLQVLKRHSQKVYASPSRRRMDVKGDVEEITYPNVCFMVDNFDEIFCDMQVRDGEMVCVELVAADRKGQVQGVPFLGSIRYDALKRVYESRASLSSKMAQQITFGLFSNSNSQRIEFVRMKGPHGKGHAEIAVTKPKGVGVETPSSEPGFSIMDMKDCEWDSDPEEFIVFTHQRRLSDPSSNMNCFMKSGVKARNKTTVEGRSKSENEGLDKYEEGQHEIEAGDLRDDLFSSEPELLDELRTVGNFRNPRWNGKSDGKLRTNSFCTQNQNRNRKPFQKKDSGTPNSSVSSSDTQKKCGSSTKAQQQLFCLDRAPSLGIVSPSQVRSSLRPTLSSSERSCSGLTTYSNSSSSISDEGNMPRYRKNRNGTKVYFWSDAQSDTSSRKTDELDDGAYNPIWTMRGFTQSFHFWKENKRAQSIPLNTFLTYITLPWWSILKDILDHKESPILTF